MFLAAPSDIEKILGDFGIPAKMESFSELERYHYEQENPDSKEVRLIGKVLLENGDSLVIRFKNEEDVTIGIVESQCRFAAEMKKNGINTPRQYQSNGAFARWYSIGGYDVIVTVEQFVENQVRTVDTAAAEKTGALLANMHNISEKLDLHVENQVLFDPFDCNDLFDFSLFASLGTTLCGDEKELFDRITEKYHACMNILLPLKAQRRYAVQGDISDCNLYADASGEIGVFDYNRCGDNNLFCDAVMQGLFEARLMDYPENAPEDLEAEILTSFFRGYCSVRPFSKEQHQWYPYLYAVIDAFWLFDLKWKEDSLMNAVENRDTEKVREWLETIWARLSRAGT